MPITLDFVADILCPWCAIARRRLDAACASLAATGLDMTWIWRPYLLDPAAPPGGTPRVLHLARRFGSMSAAERYHDGVAEAGRAVGLDFRYDRIAQAPSAVDAHRMMLSVAGEPAQARLAETLTTAFFTDGRDLGNRAVLAELAIPAGLDAHAVRTMLDGPAFNAEVHASDRAAKQAGIASVPAFCLHGRILNVPDPASLHGAIVRAHMALSGVTQPISEPARTGHGTSDKSFEQFTNGLASR